MCIGLTKNNLITPGCRAVLRSLRGSNSPTSNLFFDFLGSRGSIIFSLLADQEGGKKTQKGENWKSGNLTLSGIIQPTYTPKINQK